MTPVRSIGIDHIDLSVRDLARSEKYYDAVLPALGFRKEVNEGTIVWRCSHMEIGIRAATSPMRPAPYDRYDVGLHHLAFRAESRADVERFYEYLKDRKLEILDPPARYPQYEPDYYAVFFADPDGMKLELVYRSMG